MNLSDVGIHTAQDLRSLSFEAFEITLARSLNHGQLSDAVRLRRGFESMYACDRALEALDDRRVGSPEGKCKGKCWRNSRSHSRSPSGGKGKGRSESQSPSRSPRGVSMPFRTATVISKQ